MFPIPLVSHGRWMPSPEPAAEELGTPPAEGGKETGAPAAGVCLGGTESSPAADPPGKGQLRPRWYSGACPPPPARAAPAVTLPFPTWRCQTSRADLWRREDAIKAPASEDAAAAPPLHFDQEHAAGAAAACQWEPGPAASGTQQVPRRGDGSLRPGMLVAGLEERDVLVASGGTHGAACKGSDKCHPSGKKPFRAKKMSPSAPPPTKDDSNRGK